jgi:hypothetical protein
VSKPRRSETAGPLPAPTAIRRIRARRPARLPIGGPRQSSTSQRHSTPPSNTRRFSAASDTPGRASALGSRSRNH